MTEFPVRHFLSDEAVAHVGEQRFERRTQPDDNARFVEYGAIDGVEHRTTPNRDDPIFHAVQVSNGGGLLFTKGVDAVVVDEGRDVTDASRDDVVDIDEGPLHQLGE